MKLQTCGGHTAGLLRLGIHSSIHGLPRKHSGFWLGQLCPFIFSFVCLRNLYTNMGIDPQP